ncbi:hypothetical protein [Nocardia sp. NPDC050406]|uniref:hypothetical protein n=1 Tax=Nocardia sp. NPDC050406 TaxID=3364318 RepID=UPI0037B0B75D
MANKRPPVNRVTPKRRPAAQRSSGARTTAADLRQGENTRAKASTATRASSAPRGKVRFSKSDTAAPRGDSRAADSGSVWQTWRTAIVCGAAALLLAAFAVVAAFRPGVDDSNLAYVDNKATDEVKAAAANALSTVFAYNAKDIDGYKDRARAVLTGKMLTEFDQDKLVETGIDAIKQTQTDAEVKTEPMGVTLLTEDRAELLVDLSVSAVKDGVPQQSASGPVVLRMQKVGDRWLAAEIADR